MSQPKQVLALVIIIICIFAVTSQRVSKELPPPPQSEKVKIMTVADYADRVHAMVAASRSYQRQELAKAKQAKVAQEKAAAKPQPQPSVAKTVASPVSNGTIWDRIAQCESGGNWTINTGNGYYGGLQFSLSSWRAVGGTGYPNQASREVQIQMGKRLLARQGWGAWPVCSQIVGVR